MVKVPVPPAHLPPIGEFKMTAVADLKPFLKNLNCRFIVTKKGSCSRACWLSRARFLTFARWWYSHILSIVESGKVAKEGGMVYTFQVADETASVIATLWNEVGQTTQVGDIILMVGGYGDAPAAVADANMGLGLSPCTGARSG